jgi:adenine-specific DNA-methyltransferase
MLYVQEKVHPKQIVDDLTRQSDAAREALSPAPDLFADFNGLADPEARAEFYQHPMYWQNRMILGDALQVMASLGARESLRGKVQCIYFDPPYGIKFNSNWQVSTLSRDVKDGKRDDISREPEQVKAFRDTWKDQIHSYLTYLRDRLTVARDLLAESGSIFVQIGDENVHRVRALMDEVFGQESFCREIVVLKASAMSSSLLPSTNDFIVWYARNADRVKFRLLLNPTDIFENPNERYICVETEEGELIDLSMKQKLRQAPIPDGRVLRIYPTYSQTGGPSSRFEFFFQGEPYRPPGAYGWQTNERGLGRLARSGRLVKVGSSLGWKAYFVGARYRPFNTVWSDLRPGGFGEGRVYVVQTDTRVVERCILMTTDPGELVLDPTCGSGTTATVAEQLGRHWITIDTSRVALALARTRLMGARYPYFLLADSVEGRVKEQEITKGVQPDTPPQKDIRQGFVNERIPHITLKSIANNAEIDVIWENWRGTLEPLRTALNAHLARNEPWEEWQIPREPGDPWPEPAAKLHTVVRDEAAGEKKRLAALAKLNKELGRAYILETLPATAVDPWTDEEAIKIHAAWWHARIASQKEIEASIDRAADVEYLYDRPYVDNSKVRVAGPFTVESLSPHRVVTSRDDSDELAGGGSFQRGPKNVPEVDFGGMVLEHLRSAGVHQKDKADAIRFSSLEPWPGEWVAAEGRFTAGDGRERRAAIFVGPEFGTVTRADLTAAAREASEARFDLLISCAFSYDAHASELSRLGPLAILKARMNPDLHMAGELKNTGKGNLFVVFGEPDIDLLEEKDGQIRIKVNGIDVFDPATGEIRSDDTKGIACWFIDTNYNEESFFVRHAYFLGASDPYQSLKTALKTEIDEDVWASLYSDTSRPFPRPSTGRIAVKVINHFGDEVLKVFGV